MSRNDLRALTQDELVKTNGGFIGEAFGFLGGAAGILGMMLPWLAHGAAAKPEIEAWPERGRRRGRGRGR
jgi:hypothetical protein